MPRCLTCKAKDEELQHLRKQVLELVGHVVELSNRVVPRMMYPEESKTCWDGGREGQVEYDEFGHKGGY